jgi:hypothetical protein
MGGPSPAAYPPMRMGRGPTKGMGKPAERRLNYLWKYKMLRVWK